MKKKLAEHLQGIYEAVIFMYKMNSIDTASYKTLTEAIDKALALLKEK